MRVVRIAGGIVWRRGIRGVEVALHHRPRRDEWSLPKGEVEAAEVWHEAALRRVAEETSCSARLLSFAGASAYEAPRGLEIIFYWNMELLREGPSLTAVWLRPADAIEELDLPPERRLLARAWARRTVAHADDGIQDGGGELEQARRIMNSALLTA
jgi:8-oxo-(d)GTP phosphatase